MSWKDDEAMLRARWQELQDRRAEILAIAGPLRQSRDAYVQQTTAKIKQLDADVRVAEAGLFDIENERARIARQLGAKSVRVR